MKVLVTGTAGFIGFHLAERLLNDGHHVLGIDCLTDYYDVSLKESRVTLLRQHPNFTEHRIDLAIADKVRHIFDEEQPEVVYNLAAQAGVSQSLKDPWAYCYSNINGFLSILEACRANPVQHLVFASTSSIYGANRELPFREQQGTQHPLTLYAASKKANEMMAHSYANLFGVPSTGVRFFTVYGPYGRPDMALFKFTKAILAGEAIDVYDIEHMQRDFTYVDDIVEGLVRLLTVPPEIDDSVPPEGELDPSSSPIAPYRILNIGNGRIEKLSRYIEVLEDKLGRKAKINHLPIQPFDVPATWADTSALKDLTGYAPSTSIDEGVGKFVDWYLAYYDVTS